ncbi:membrane protein [Allostella vacuolata]|nr:membrane protein [Stella vacuolata]
MSSQTMAMSALAEPAPLLDLELRPHRSLSPAGFTLLMAVLGGFGFVTGVLFLAIGAWPVFGFLGLDVLGVYVAFRVSYARARSTADHVRLTGDALTVDQLRPRRAAERWTFQPYWLRVVLDQGRPAGRDRLVLTSHGRRLEVGAFLGPDERARVADLLRDALRRYREPDRNPSTSIMS